MKTAAVKTMPFAASPSDIIQVTQPDADVLGRSESPWLRVLLRLGAVLCFVPETEAQVVNDGETNTLSSGIHFFAGDVTVGFDNSFTRLNIVNGAVLTNSGEGYIGTQYTNYTDDPPFAPIISKSNLVTVEGLGSRWDLDDGNPFNGNNVLNVGYNGTYNTLLVTDGGMVSDDRAFIGYGGSHNLAIVSGTNSQWKNLGQLSVGGPGHGSDILLGRIYGKSNTLLITNGGSVLSDQGCVGNGPNGNPTLSQAIVTGPGSLWANSSYMYVGYQGRLNSLLIADGGRVSNGTAYMGYGFGSDFNQVTVSGSNSMWLNSSALIVGIGGNSNNLTIADGGMVKAGYVIQVGHYLYSGGNVVTVNDGSLIADYPGTSSLDIVSGKVVFNGGRIATDQLLLSYDQGTLDFNAGTLAASFATVSNSVVFVVGDGTGAATYHLSGLPMDGGIPSDVHSFYDGLLITNNARLTGNGTIVGMVTVASGGTLAPGTSVGKIMLSNAPVLQGDVIMETSKSAVTLTNDQIQVAGTLIYGGSLTVSNLGPMALAGGNRFQLFNAAAYSGGFAKVTLPSLPPGLTWTNKLLVDGSIAVLGPLTPRIAAVTNESANLILNVTDGPPGGKWEFLTSTNVTLPLSNWTTNGSGSFDGSGYVTLTNALNPVEPQRFFLIKALGPF